MRRLAQFVWDFIVGDDWRVAAGVVAALAITAATHAWWLLPLAVASVLALSVGRYAVRPRR